MVRHLKGAKSASERKQRLFVVAACRAIVHLCPDPVVARAALETAERFADGSETAVAVVEAEGAVGLSAAVRKPGRWGGPQHALARRDGRPAIGRPRREEEPLR
jgi:hypothetical protein